MKLLGILILAAVVGFLGYQVAYPKIFDPTFFPKDPQPVALTKPLPEAPKVVKITPKAEEPKAEMPKAPEPKPEPEMPKIVANTGMGEAVKKDDNPDEFHPPNFPPLADVVKNWTQIPKKAFPRPVKLLKDVEFVMAVGKAKVGAGGTATALDQDGDMLIVSPSETSPAHSQVALNETDLKETLTEAYENWKTQMTEYKRRQFEFRKNASEHHQDEAKPGAATPAMASNDKPERSPDGTYPVLLASMKAGQVTEITPTNVKKWSEVAKDKIDGKDYWTVIVSYTTKTMFGDFDTEAQARILNGRVEKWVYTGSGEVVP